ncbi:MAG: amidohydrolase family protein [Planctomycetota bacterium]|nr:amidohydrolase family protein [Planctomycetota bacterium]
MLSTILLCLAPLGGNGEVAVQAGTIHTVDATGLIEGGGTVLIDDGVIVAVGPSDGPDAVPLPIGVRVVDYGPDAVIAPGLVAADSTLGGRIAGPRTADASLRGTDHFNPYGRYTSSLAGGVTTAYIAPARSRLLAGQGAVVKLAGEPGPDRILADAAALHGSIASDARSTPGYWEPPIPATVDVGMGVERKQLPKTTAGALVALGEILDLARSKSASEEYGPQLGPELASHLERGTPWRMRAEDAEEAGALLDFFGGNGLPLVIAGTHGAGETAERIAAAGSSVVLSVPVRPGASLLDRGKGETSVWPEFGVAAKLAAAGVPFAIAPGGQVSASNLRFAARVASRGGLDAAQALEAITIAPARILGVSERVGSIAVGKDADLCVLNGPPLDMTSSVRATWVGGEPAWSVEDGATVLEVDELFVGDGTILAPGQLLMDEGRIVEVGRKVAHPAGCTVVRGRAAMPGVVDALGHLGLEGSGKVPKTRFAFEAIIEPGDEVDRRVARAGVTTVVMTPRGVNKTGAPAMAYKPAASNLERMVVADPAVVHLNWTDSNRYSAGAVVRDSLAKALEYRNKWDEYEKAIAAWTPPPPEPPEEEDEDEDGDEEDENGEGEEEDEDDEEDEDAPPAPVTGVWVAEISLEGGDPTRLRLQLFDEAGALSGRLRCDTLSAELVRVEGALAEGELELEGVGTGGRLRLTAEVQEVEKKKKKKKRKKDDDEPEPEPQKRKLVGTVAQGEASFAFSAEQTSTEYRVAGRPERRKVVEEKVSAPKGKPKSPGVNPDLEPLRRAMEGSGAVAVIVHRQDEILACVDAFEAVGIRPVLRGATDAWKVAERLRGRVAGVLLDHRVVVVDAAEGYRARRNRYAELAAAGVPVAFHSAAEEGAAELPMVAAYAVSQGMSPSGALRALTVDAAAMMDIDDRVGRLAAGLDADVLLLDGSPLELDTSIERVWVAGREIGER